MTRIRVPLGKFIKEYSERNKGNEDIPVYIVRDFVQNTLAKRLLAKTKPHIRLFRKVILHIILRG